MKQKNSKFKPDMKVAVMALRHVSMTSVLMAAAVITAFGIHSAFAAPDGPPTTPALNVIPNFDGLNITDGGVIRAKDAGDVTRVEINGQEGAIKLKDTAGTTDVYSVDANAVNVQLQGTGAKFSVDGDNGISEWDDDSITFAASGSTRVNLAATSNGGDLEIFSTNAFASPYFDVSVTGTTSEVDLGGGTIDTSQVSNTSSAALGDVYVNDDIRVGSAYSLKVDNITSSSGSYVQADDFYANNILGDSITATTGIGRYYEKNTYGSRTVNAGSSEVIITTCDPGDYVIACAGQLDLTAPYDIDYRGAWKTSSTQCSAAFVNKKGTNYTGNMGGSAYCFSPNG